jgi:hypothetical protein
MSEVLNDSEDISAGIGFFFFKSDTKEFCPEYHLKSARSTLTSPGTIRVINVMCPPLLGSIKNTKSDKLNENHLTLYIWQKGKKALNLRKKCLL